MANDPNKYGTPVMVSQGEHSYSEEDKRTFDMYGFRTRKSFDEFVAQATRMQSPGMVAMSILSDCQEAMERETRTPQGVVETIYTRENIRKHINTAKYLIDKSEEDHRTILRLQNILGTKVEGTELVNMVIDLKGKSVVLDEYNKVLAERTQGKRDLKKESN